MFFDIKEIYLDKVNKLLEEYISTDNNLIKIVNNK